jgi:hypothetical protein
MYRIIQIFRSCTSCMEINLEISEGAVSNGQSRDIDNIGYTRHRTNTYNTETSTTLGTQDTGRRHTIQRHRQHWVHKTQDEDIQSRDIDNIGYTIHRTKTYNPETSTTLGTQYTGRRHTIQRHRQHWVHKTQNEDIQSRDIDNIGYTIHRTKTYNPKTSTTLGTQYTGRRHTIQRHRQHWVHNTQAEYMQSRDIDNIGYTIHRTKTYNPETSTTLGTQDTERRHTIQRHRQH